MVEVEPGIIPDSFFGTTSGDFLLDNRFSVY